MIAPLSVLGLAAKPSYLIAQFRPIVMACVPKPFSAGKLCSLQGKLGEEEFHLIALDLPCPHNGKELGKLVYHSIALSPGSQVEHIALVLGEAFPIFLRVREQGAFLCYEFWYVGAEPMHHAFQFL